jgi:hypothetical protein
VTPSFTAYHSILPQYDTTRRCTLFYNTTQHNTTQHNTTQHNTLTPRRPPGGGRQWSIGTLLTLLTDLPY